MTKKTTETAVAVTDPERFAVCSPQGAEDLATMLEGGVGVFDLTRLKVPSSGAVAFEIDALEGVKYETELECVIVLVQGGQRAWWKNPLGAGGGGTPPDCSSKGGGVGMGDPEGSGDGGSMTHQCASCHWNQWGTATRPDGTQGKGKSCKEFAFIFLYREGDGIPMVLSVPPSSLGLMRRYSTKLLSASKPIHTVVTKVSLSKTANTDGVDYSEIVFAYGGDLSDDGAASAKSAQKVLKQYLASNAVAMDIPLD